MKNNTFQELAEVLSSARQILIYPHVNMDGDALGSAAALCKGLRSMGKECHVLIEDGIPANLAFLDQGYCTFDQNVITAPDLSVCVDCGDPSRFERRQAAFEKSSKSMCIDHHETTTFYCDYNYVDKDAAATGELIYRLLQTLGIALDKEMGEAIFAAITTDTGNFQYSNTSKESHLIAAELYDIGIDANKVSVEIYENMRIEKLLIENMALATMSTVAGGRGVIAYVTQDMLSESGALMEETEGVVQRLRSISGVEVAAFLKETKDGRIKLSLRSKSCVDVARIASELGGGGHIRAAGATLTLGLSEAFDLLKEKIIKSIG
ncbi:MAG: bifunctional oligoribonuclease/PAP phosphatase NrnA [Emergencia sp.]|uniref:DHH family phosphoesterase n=1 Tax=Senimuribacter intestinalis TaxID=2941507 RepID=UPI0020418348|nr:bifunctional oligoribonuclease/PAP phosphatase NrnA [Senimuribacter intestinalis]MCI9638815.1 bifunctional oligoribonuclease/PAP phosphatase NrnA [Emergencia sp.]